MFNLIFCQCLAVVVICAPPLINSFFISEVPRVQFRPACMTALDLQACHRAEVVRLRPNLNSDKPWV